MFENKNSYVAQICGDDMHIKTADKNGITKFKESMNRFDSDFCDDDIWLEIFLDRLKNNKPLEILIGNV